MPGQGPLYLTAWAGVEVEVRKTLTRSSARWSLRFTIVICPAGTKNSDLLSVRLGDGAKRAKEALSIRVLSNQTVASSYRTVHRTYEGCRFRKLIELIDHGLEVLLVVVIAAPLVSQYSVLST